jgi:hypothetical protein
VNGPHGSVCNVGGLLNVMPESLEARGGFPGPPDDDPLRQPHRKAPFARTHATGPHVTRKGVPVARPQRPHVRIEPSVTPREQRPGRLPTAPRPWRPPGSRPFRRVGVQLCLCIGMHGGERTNPPPTVCACVASAAPNADSARPVFALHGPATVRGAASSGSETPCLIAACECALQRQA